MQRQEGLQFFYFQNKSFTELGEKIPPVINKWRSVDLLYLHLFPDHRKGFDIDIIH